MAIEINSKTIEGYQQRLTLFRDVDAEKNEMVDELVKSLETLQANYMRMELDLANEKQGRQNHQIRVKELEDLIGRRSFVLVLIDADADDYVFHDRFLNRGEAGGRDAADEIHAQVSKYMVDNLGIPANTHIVVRAYMNMQGMQQACVKDGRITNGASLTSFIHGFTKRQGLFDFVDVGHGKEGADHKVRECLEFFVENVHCKHIILCACHDSGYAPSLAKFAGVQLLREKMTLLPNGYVPPSIRNLGFTMSYKFDAVFAPRFSPIPPNPRVTNPTSSTPEVPTATTSGMIHVNPAPLSERLGPVLRNEDGLRVDKTLDIKPDPPLIGAFLGAKLCQWYYLRGECSGGCGKNHNANPLKSKEFDHLWYLARGGLCFRIRKGKDCDDPKCIYRHEEVCRIGSGTVKDMATQDHGT